MHLFVNEYLYYIKIISLHANDCQDWYISLKYLDGSNYINIQKQDNIVYIATNQRKEVWHKRDDLKFVQFVLMLRLLHATNANCLLN